MSVKSDLEAGLAIIRDPAKHCTYRYAEDADGRGVDPADPQAVKWCSLGVLYKHADIPFPYGAIGELSRAARTLFGAGVMIADVNDRRTHAEVLRMWETAIANAREEDVS